MTSDHYPLDQEQLLARYRLLLHHVLHQYHLLAKDQDYDDYFNELYLHLVRLARDFDGDALSESDRFRFVGYAQRGLSWHLGQLLAKRSRQAQGLIGNQKVLHFAEQAGASRPPLDDLVNSLLLSQVLSPADYLSSVWPRTSNSHLGPNAKSWAYVRIPTMPASSAYARPCKPVTGLPKCLCQTLQASDWSA